MPETGGEREDLGQPIEELRGLVEAPSSGFHRRLFGSIERRQLASHAVDLSWTGFMAVVRELLNLLSGLAVAQSTRFRTNGSGDRESTNEVSGDE